MPQQWTDTAMDARRRRGLCRSRHADLASDAGQQQIESYRSLGYASLPAIPAGESSVTVPLTPQHGLPGGAGTATLARVDGSYAPATEDTGRIQVTVSVTWTGISADHGTVTMSTLI